MVNTEESIKEGGRKPSRGFTPQQIDLMRDVFKTQPVWSLVDPEEKERLERETGIERNGLRHWFNYTKRRQLKNESFNQSGNIENNSKDIHADVEQTLRQIKAELPNSSQPNYPSDLARSFGYTSESIQSQVQYEGAAVVNQPHDNHVVEQTELSSEWTDAAAEEGFPPGWMVKSTKHADRNRKIGFIIKVLVSL